MDDVVFMIVGAIWFGILTSLAYYRPKLLCRFFGVEANEKYLRRAWWIGTIGVVSLCSIVVTLIGKLIMRLIFA
jgi:hypothetical protein